MATTKANLAKREKLGMSEGGAYYILKKLLMFSLIQETGRDTCYRCNELIEDPDDLSIEHKESWFLDEEPLKKFLDYNNLSYSHLKCNSAAAHKPNKIYETAKDQKRASHDRWYEKYKDRINSTKRAKRQAIKENTLIENRIT